MRSNYELNPIDIDQEKNIGYPIMPGFELIDKKEKDAVIKIFDQGGILMAHGFDNLRKKFHVRDLKKILKKELTQKTHLPYHLEQRG